MDGPHFFQAVFDAFESLEDLADDVEGRSGSIGQENRSQAILDIMLAKEVQVRFGTDDGILSMEAQDKLSVPIKGPFRDFAARREIDDRTGHVFRHGPYPFVIVIEDSVIALVLVEENPFLGSGIAFHRMMAVQVVRRDVEDCRGLGLDAVREFELETGQFSDDDGFFWQVVGLGRQAVADIAADDGLTACGLHDFADQGRRRRLAIGPSNADHVGIGDPAGDFDFTPDWQAAAGRFFHDRDFRRNDRRRDDDIHAVQKSRFLAAEDQLDAGGLYIRPRLFRRVDGLHIIQRNGPAMTCQGQRGSAAADACADD